MLERVAEHIRRQEYIISDLEVAGRHQLVIEARELLAKFQALQSEDYARRSRLLKELELTDTAASTAGQSATARPGQGA